MSLELRVPRYTLTRGERLIVEWEMRQWCRIESITATKWFPVLPGQAYNQIISAHLQRDKQPGKISVLAENPTAPTAPTVPRKSTNIGITAPLESLRLKKAKVFAAPLVYAVLLICSRTKEVLAGRKGGFNHPDMRKTSEPDFTRIN